MPRRNMSESSIGRRKILKMSGAGMFAATVAGCSGNGNGDTVTEGGGGTDDTVTSTSKDLSDVELNYWNSINVQSTAARTESERIVEKFRNRTGATANVNWSGYGQIVGADWLQQFQRGNQPVVYDSVSRFGGQFATNDWLVPFSEWRDELPDDVLNNIEWSFDSLRDQYRGFDGEIFEIPIGFGIQTPFVARMDHFEQAGLDPSSDFPPENYEDLIEVATTLQDQGPGEFGFQIHGAVFDVTDAIPLAWNIARGGSESGTWLNDDWSDTIFDNDTWTTTYENYVDVYREHGLSNDSTPTFDDENVPALMTQGQVSMSQHDFIGFHSVYQETAGELYENGTIQWGSAWEGPSGQRGGPTFFSIGITKPPEGANQSAWERKQEAAVELVKVWLSKDVQRQAFENFGVLPARQDLWEEALPDGPHRAKEVNIEMAESSQTPWEAHPKFTAMAYTTPGPHLQQALQGEKEPAQAVQDAAAEIRNNLL